MGHIEYLVRETEGIIVDTTIKKGSTGLCEEHFAIDLRLGLL